MAEEQAIEFPTEDAPAPAPAPAPASAPAPTPEPAPEPRPEPTPDTSQPFVLAAEAPIEGTRVFRHKQWYRVNLDWRKSNSELAGIAGVTRQRITQLRKEFYPDGKVPIAPTKPVVETPNFDDIEPNARIVTETQFVEQPKVEKTPPIVPVNYQALSEMTFDVTTGMLCRLFGPEWQAASADERTAMVTCIKKYAESKQLPDISPGWMLVIMSSIYSMPRITQPNTKSKIQLTWLWIKTKIFRMKSKIPAMPTIV